jgi:hypothetical protein
VIPETEGGGGGEGGEGGEGGGEGGGEKWFIQIYLCIHQAYVAEIP